MGKVFLHGVIKLKGDKVAPFKVNRQCAKHNVGTTKEMRLCEKVNLDEV